MPIPDYQTIMLPLLELAGNGEAHNIHTATEKLADHFNLSEEEVTTLLPSGVQPKFFNRVGWAKTYLKKSGLLDYPTRAHFKITEMGKQVLDKNPPEINNAFLRQFPEFIEFRRRSSDSGKDEGQEEDFEELTPEEAIESAFQNIRKDLADELLEFILKSTPGFFEKLVVELLVKMGYGGTQREAARAIGKSGDGGIDGIIDEDRLGLDSIYIQAKKWRRDAKVGRPEIQRFVGALQGIRAKKGVFITTASFTDEAREYVQDIETKVVLLDGEHLTKLMIDHSVGVTTRTRYDIKELDSDYFGEISREIN